MAIARGEPQRRQGEGTTCVGYVNRNGQRNLGRAGCAGTDHCQQAYKMCCRHCGATYACNGSDIFQKKCPECQGGRPGILLHFGSR